MEYYSAMKRNAYESVLMRWMNLEPSIQWSQSEREKQIYIGINTYIWNLERWYWWAYLQGSNGDADIDNRLVDTVGKGEGGTNWESSIETYTWPYIKSDSHWKFVVCCRELKSGALWQPRGVGWGGRFKKERTYVYLCLIHVDVLQKPSQYCKSSILQLKIN